MSGERTRSPERGAAEPVPPDVRADLAALAAPRDPRGDLDLPGLGALATVEHLDEAVTCVLAPNPGIMSLDGTNTYVVGAPGGGSAIVVDPGPTAAEHREQVEQVLADRDLGCALIVATHHHVDHAEAAHDWAAAFGCRVAAADPDVAGEGGLRLTDGQTLAGAGLPVEVVATPGHCGDHLAFRLGHGPLLTGDHVLGRGTSVVAHPDGDLLAYLASLRRVLDLGPDALYPGHGPALTTEPEPVLDFYLRHRAFREAQVMIVLRHGPHTPRQLVEMIYADVDEDLHDAAERSTRAALAKLAGEGRVVERDDVFRALDA